MRDLIEEIRTDTSKIDELVRMIRERQLRESELKELIDLLVRLKDRDQEAYRKLLEELRKYVSMEELEACVEENIEEYEL